MADLRQSLKDIADRHAERMENDPHYKGRVTHFEALNEQWKKDAAARQRYYDRDGYCDNPARGY